MSNPSKSLNKKYILAISIIVILVSISQLILQVALIDQKEDGRYINIAGRQRMLSERIVKYVLASIETQNKKKFDEFVYRSEVALNQWKIAQNALQYGDEKLQLSGINSNQIKDELMNVDSLHLTLGKLYRKYHLNIKETGFEKRNHKLLIELGDMLLENQYLYVEHMEKIVHLYEIQLSEKISRMQQLEIYLFLFTICVIYLEILYIFRPATLMLSKQWEELISLNGRLKDEKEKAEFFIAKSEQNTKVKTNFLSKVSHEFRTPLNGIFGMANLLRMSDLNAEQKEFTQVITDSGKRLLKLVDDVLMYSRLHSSELNKKNEVFDVSKLLFDIGLEFSKKYESKKIELEIKDETDMPDQLQGDKGKISLIIKNILDNAYKFTKEGKISIYLEYFDLGDNNSNVCIKIQDTGIGVSVQNQKQIFEMFNQVDNSSTRPYEGLGNGLTLSKELVNYLNGKLVLESEEGSGTTVSIILPFKRLDKYDE